MKYNVIMDLGIYLHKSLFFCLGFWYSMNRDYPHLHNEFIIGIPLYYNRIQIFVKTPPDCLVNTEEQGAQAIQ